MKTSIVLGFTLMIGSTAWLEAQNVTSQSAQTPTLPAPTPFAVIAKDANSSVWQRTVYQRGASGQAVPVPHRFTELATGLHYWQNGQWLDSKEEIDILPNGTAAATQGQHQAYFPGDIYQGQIELVTPDGEKLFSRPLGLSYFDGTNNVLIAVLTNSIGQVLGANQVIYTNAFTGLDADLLYTYTKAGFEQDIVLRQQPLTPESYGLNPDTASLRVYTEFFSPPQPASQTSILPVQAGLLLTDDSLGFGQMEMMPGRAFFLGQNARNVGAMVGKQWVQLEGRQFLVEEVPVNAIVAGLAALPLTGMNEAPHQKGRLSLHEFKLPPRRLAENNISKGIMLARGDLPAKGLVLDYQAVNSSQTNYTFQGDTTYYISGTVNLFGTNTFEGGAIIKYTNNASLNFNASAQINCLTAAYRPVVFTAMDDNSVGDAISGSTGSPSGYYAVGALIFSGNTISLQNIRIAFAQSAILGYGTVSLTNVQMINCENGIKVGGNYEPLYVNMRNALMANVLTNYNLVLLYDTPASIISAQNVTFANPSTSGIYSLLGLGSFKAYSVGMTNCILANMNFTNFLSQMSGGCNGFYNAAQFGSAPVTNNFYPFQTVGAGSYYLTNGCAFTNAGTTTIDATLLASLAQKTTYPPIFYSNVTIMTNITLGIQAQRDTNSSPCLGYHYDPLDYLLDNFWITNAILTVTNGTAIGYYYDPGIVLTDGGTLNSIGNAVNPNWLVRYTSVQEQPIQLGTGIGSSVAVNPYHFYSPPNALFQFTKFAFPAGGSYHLYDEQPGSPGWSYNSLVIQNCEFWGGANNFSGGSNSVEILQNDLFARTAVTASPTITGYKNVSLAISNCLFWNTPLTLLARANSNLWYVFNNDFDGATIKTTGPGGQTYTINGYNAYLNSSTNRLYPTNAFDIVSTNSLAYQTGPLGGFYQPTTSPLLNMGSTTADQVGLYHYTVTTNEVVEGTNIVSIGYHYVAVDANGNPLDSNGDGIPDYVEDANGNGVVDGGEIAWSIAIVTQPANQTTVQGSNATFTVTAAGTAPLSYQWYFNGTNIIAGGTSASLNLTNVQTTNEGNYSVVITNIGGSVTSAVAVLALTCDVTPSGLVAWWPGNGDAGDNAGTNNGTLQGGAGYTNGMVGQAFSFDGSSGYVEVGDIPDLVMSNTFAFEAWIYPTGAGSGGSGSGGILINKEGEYEVARFADGSIEWYFANLPNWVSSGAVAPLNQWSHVAVTYSNGIVKTYLNGSLTNTYNGSGHIGVWGLGGPYDFRIGGRSYAYDHQLFKGFIDEVSVYNRALTSNEVAIVYNAGSAGKCLPSWPVPPTPTNLIATAISPTQIGLTWDVVSGGATQISIERSASSNGTYTAIAQVANANSYLDTNLTAGTTYYYQVQAIYMAVTWSAPSSVAWATTPTNGSDLPLGSLALWLKADAGLLQGSANTPVNIWPDQSGIGNNAMQTTGAYEPTWIPAALGDRPVMRFNGTNSYFSLPNFMSGATQGEAFVVLKVSDTNRLHSLWWMGTDGSVNNPKTYPNTDGTVNDDFGSSAVQHEGVPAQALTQYHLYEVMSQNNNWAAWFNGALQYQSTNNVVAFQTSPTIGQSSYIWGCCWTSGYFAGDIAEVLVFNRALTASERQAAIGYLNSKYVFIPIISLTTPTNSQVFATPASIVISAKAKATAGISKVQFFQGATSLGILTNEPFTVVWTNPAPGTYALTAQATAMNGITSTSSVVNVTVDVPPNMTLTSPTNNAVIVAGANVNLAASATDPDGTISQVQFFQGTTSLGIVTSSPYGLIWSNVTAGTYSLTAQAKDNNGIISTSSAVNVILDLPPSVTLTNPANNATFVAVTNISLGASASDSDGTISQVQFFNGASSLGVATSPPYSLTWSNVPVGTYGLTACATDNNGLSTTSSVVSIISVGVLITNPPNYIVLTAPANVSIGAAIIDNTGVRQVQFFQGTSSLGIVTNSPYSLTWTNVSQGVYVLTADATDNNGLVLISSGVSVIVDTDPHTTDRDGDGVDDYTEYLEGRNPLVAGAVPDTNGVVNLQVYTPLNH